MRQKDLKYFGDPQSGRLNSDDSPFAITTNEWVNAENVRSGSTDKGSTGIIESVGGNVQRSPEQQQRITYYLNIDAAIDADGYQLGLDKSNYDNGSGNEITLNGGESIYFITNPSEPNITYIEDGVWGINFYVSNPDLILDSDLEISIYQADSSGSISSTLGSGHISIPHNTGIIGYNINLSVAATPFNITDRIIIGFNNPTSEGSLIFYPNSASNNYTAYAITNIPAVNIPSVVSRFDYQYITIGSVEDTENKRIVYFNYDASIYRNDKIVCFYTDTNTEYNVLLSGQVTNQSNHIIGLNFSKDSLIHSAKISGNVLSWVDGTNNEPRKINIESGIAANNPGFATDEVPYVFPLNFWEITMIKRPPIYTPNIAKQIDVDFSNNFIADGSFEFAYQYQYYDGEVSVVSSYSQASRPNFPDQTTLNYINVQMDVREKIPNTVKIVNLIVRIGDGSNDGSNNACIIKTWDKDSIDDNNAINNHNAGTLLTYKFYNSITGEFLPTDDVLRPFDSVPIYSQTHEVAKNRYFLANNTEGYNTPTYTSLKVTLGDLIPITSNSQTVSIFKFYAGHYYDNFFNRVFVWSYASYVVYLFQGVTPGYYIVNGTENRRDTNSSSRVDPNTLPSGAISFSSLIYGGRDLIELFNFVRGSRNNANVIFYATEIASPATAIVTFSNVPTEYTVWTQKSPYKFGIVFYDYAMRKSSVCIKNPYYSNDNIEISIPQRNYAYNQVYSYINWELNNTNLLNEIPEWAYYYSIVRTLNLRTRLFIDSQTKLKYATKDNTGIYNYQQTYDLSVVAIAIDITNLLASNIGYAYNKGDLSIIWAAGGIQIYELPIIGQDGNYVLVSPKDIGTIGLTDIYSYELYTPYKENTNEPYYEMGEIYEILNPTTSQRQFSNYSGSLFGDSYVIKRVLSNTPSPITYLAGAMSPNDLFWQQWETDAGKVNVVSSLGRQTKTRSISYSDSYIPGTQVNGTSTFRLGNEIAVPEDCGSITKLQLTSKVQSQGAVMLSICNSETNSMYLGETQIIDTTGGTQFFAGSQGVISTINTLKGNYGCIDPSSVVQYRGNVYFFDANNGRWIQYSENGLDNISSVKMSRFWKNWSYKYMSMTKAEIEAFGNRPYVFATVDAGHDELLISIPKLSNDPPKGYLPDYPDMVYPFDMLDFQGKTIVYNIGTLANINPHWQGAYTFNTEYFVTIQNRLFTFKNGYLYEHNQDDQGLFFGERYSSKIMFTSNILPQVPKVYDNILSESNLIPTFVYFYNDYPYLQTSDLDDTSFKSVEGIWYAPILRNKIVPTNTGFTTDGLFTSEVMRNVNMYVLAQYHPTTTPLELRIIELGTSISKGHIV